MNQKEHIQNLLKMKPSGFDPYVETHRETDEGLEYSNWEKYEGQEQVDERSILPNEVVIDIDADTTEKCREENRQVTSMLENNGLPFFVADTGGTGFHIHIFFEIPENAEDLDSYRSALYQWIKKEAEENTQVDTDLWDDGVANFTRNGAKGHLVRAVGGRKSETGFRKTEVTPTSLDKEEVIDEEDVDYPVLDSRNDFWRISKLDSSNADLSWTEVTEKADEIQEKREKEKKKKLESTYEAEDDGLQALRDLPSHEVLKAFFDKDIAPGDHLYCPIHGSSETGTEEAQVTEDGKYRCFGDSCTKDGENLHWHNAIDLLVEGLNKDFTEAKEELAEEFDVDLNEEDSKIEEAGDVGLYFKESESRRGFQPNRLAKAIERDYDFIFNKMQEQLYYYDEGVYREDAERKVKEECNRRLKDEFKMSRVNDTLNAIKTRPGVAKSKKEFRPPEYKINFQNGVYDLMKEELVSHSKDYYFVSQIPHDYNPEAEGTKIKEFFRETTEKEEEAETLMELSGYAMLPSMPLSAAFLLVGKGDNGKTVFLNTLRELIGEEHAKDEDLQQLEHTRFATASLYRKLLVVSDDMPSTELESGGTLKGITGGRQVRAEFKGGDHFEFKNYATPVFACNDVPETEDQSDGFFRRWTIIDFPYKFTEDPEHDFEKERKSEFQLKKELFDEEQQQAYAYQAVQAVQEVLQKQAFAAQKDAEVTRQKWNGYANPVMEFIYKYIEQGVTYNEAQRNAEDESQESINSYDFDFIPKDELFDLVSAYAEARNARPPETKRELKKKLDKADFYFSTTRTTQTQFEDGRTQVYRGIKYSEEFEKLLEESESLQGFRGKLKILSASGRKRAHTNVEMRIENHHGTPGRIESDMRDLLPEEHSEEIEEILDEAEEMDYDREEAEEVIENLKSEGEAFEPSQGEVKAL